MPLPDKKTVLDWYKDFCRQLGETYGLDLTKKTDLMRLGCIRTDNPASGEIYDHPFIRHAENGYADPEPTLDYKEAAPALKLYAELKSGRFGEGEKYNEANRRYEAMAEKMDAAHNAWEIRNQTLFDASKDQDFDQIARLYEDAHAGRLFIYDETGDFSKSNMLYMGDDGTLCRGRVMDGLQTAFTCIPGVNEPVRMGTVFKRVCIGIQPIPDDMTEGYRRVRERENAIVSFVLERHPEMKTLTKKDDDICDRYIQGDLQAEMPAPVPKPGFLSAVKWFFTRNTKEYDDYDEYVRNKADWDAKMSAGKAAYEKYSLIEKELLEMQGIMPEIKDVDRRHQVYEQQTVADSIKSFSRKKQAEGLMAASKAGQCEELKEELSWDAVTMLAGARDDFRKEIAAHPEYFDRNGNRTAAGRVALANRTMNAEQKLEAVKGLDAQIAEAKESAMDRIRARLAEANTSGELTTDKAFAADVATLIQARSLEGQLTKYKKGDDLFRGFDMKKQGIEESGIYLASHASFKKAFGTKDDLREIAFDLAQSGRSPEALNSRLDSLLKRYNGARKPAGSVKQSETKTAVKAQPVQEKKNAEPEDKWIMREPKSPF